jgi:hypothetical protein
MFGPALFSCLETVWGDGGDGRGEGKARYVCARWQKTGFGGHAPAAIYASDGDGDLLLLA